MENKRALSPTKQTYLCSYPDKENRELEGRPPLFRDRVDSSIPYEPTLPNFLLNLFGGLMAIPHIYVGFLWGVLGTSFLEIMSYGYFWLSSCLHW